MGAGAGVGWGCRRGGCPVKGSWGAGACCTHPSLSNSTATATDMEEVDGPHAVSASTSTANHCPPLITRPPLAPPLPLPQQEMDYTLEAHNTITFKKNMESLQGVTVAKVFPEFTTRHIIVTQWIEVRPSLARKHPCLPSSSLACPWPEPGAPGTEASLVLHVLSLTVLPLTCASCSLLSLTRVPFWPASAE